jgi:hypothetical protein
LEGKPSAPLLLLTRIRKEKASRKRVQTFSWVLALQMSSQMKREWLSKKVTIVGAMEILIREQQLNVKLMTIVLSNKA